MEDFAAEIATIFNNPWMVKLAIAFVGLLVIRGLMFLLQRSFAKYIIDSPTNYRVRKLVTIFGYFVVILFLAIVFKDRLGGLTVAIGVAGAGVAFALQEVIASVAGLTRHHLSDRILQEFDKVSDRIAVKPKPMRPGHPPPSPSTLMLTS